MPGTHHHGVHHHGTHHAAQHNYHISPSLPRLKPSPFSSVLKDQQMRDQYNSWTEERSLTLQVIDKVGVPILETQVTRDTTVNEIRALVIKKVRERHADKLQKPVSKEGEKHRTYTALTDVGIYKIANSNDAYSGTLRELQFGERLDGCVERKYFVLCPCCCQCDRSLRIGLVLSPQHPQSIVKLLFNSSLQSAVSRSSHRNSWKSNSWREDSWDSPSPVSAGSWGGGSDGSGGSGGGGGGSG